MLRGVFLEHLHACVLLMAYMLAASPSFYSPSQANQKRFPPTLRVEAPVLQRLAGYPAAARANTHTARAVLPRRVALVLRSEPQLIAPAVEAFYGRWVYFVLLMLLVSAPKDDLAVT